MYPSHYEGTFLPYDDAQFFVVASGHVIEHTNDPFIYLSECMRVLRVGGYLSLEFPNRYHHTELHTGLPSFRMASAPSPKLGREAGLESDVSPRFRHKDAVSVLGWHKFATDQPGRCQAHVGSKWLWMVTPGSSRGRSRDRTLRHSESK